MALFWYFLFRGMEPAAHPAESESFSSPSFLSSPFPLPLSQAGLLLLRPPSLPLSGVFVVLVLRLEGSSVCHLVNANHSSALSASTVLYKAFLTSWLDRFPTPTLSLAAHLSVGAIPDGTGEFVCWAFDERRCCQHVGSVKVDTGPFPSPPWPWPCKKPLLNKC